MKPLVSVLLIMLATMPTAMANLITNGDFEDFQLQGRQWRVFNQLPGWFTSIGPGIEIQRNTIVRAQSGNQYVELDSHYGRNTNSTMSQLISTEPGQQYLLSFWYRPRTNRGHNDNGINVLWDPWALTTASHHSAAFRPSQQVLSIDNYKRRQYNFWIPFSLSLTATSNTMVLSFQADGRDNSLGGFIDNVSLTAQQPTTSTQVPAPATMALLGLALAWLGRRKKTA